MKSTCPITGIVYPVPQFTSLSSKAYPHPIFSLPVKSLLSMSGQWSSGNLTDEEKHLLFIALLGKLELVTFRSIARPSLKVMEQNYELLSQLVIWKTNSLLPNLSTVKLPGYVVEFPESEGMEKLRVFLKMLLDAKNGYQSKYASNYHLRSTAEMRANEEKLKRLINSGIRKNANGNYEKALAKFALDATGVSKEDHRYNFWIELFQVKEPDIYQISPKHFHKMRDYLEMELEGYTKEADLRALKVLSHIRNLVEIVDKGPAAYYDIHDISLTHASEYMEQLKEAAKDMSVSLDKPSQEKYRVNGKVNMVAYMTAISTWRKAMEFRRLTQEKTNQMKKDYQSNRVDEIMDSEDREYIRETPVDILMASGIQILDMED